MSKNNIVAQLISRWGIEKFVKVSALSVIAAGLTALISEAIIPSNPEEQETIKEKESK